MAVMDPLVFACQACLLLRVRRAEAEHPAHNKDQANRRKARAKLEHGNTNGHPANR
jgi:hypothetical protein